MNRLTETSLERYLRIEWANYDHIINTELKKFDELRKCYDDYQYFEMYRVKPDDTFFINGKFETAKIESSRLQTMDNFRVRMVGY